ncbi:hypothetical protein QBC42DRAFT_299895 [Cladorrhinum samala]|uniref:Uncharacterized protein n=1 Tax=Cladorrhinum samala TaxID=585594 RepID=A0AAV9HED4_9PEZI|nr:hypothetical protein QBC42DRAFT_299895 [Cladorrhinum samala]
MYTSNLLIILLGGLATASPLRVRQQTNDSNYKVIIDSNALAQALKTIMPTSDSCAGAPGPADDCRTAEQAAPFIANSSEGLGPGELAGTLALMGVESGDLKYKHNVFPGRPGQGTAGMLMPNFVAEYAASVLGAQAVAGLSPAAVLDLVTVDEHNFGSVRWFLDAKCDDGVKAALRTGSDDGFRAYMGCVGVNADDPARLAYWNRAKAALGL